MSIIHISFSFLFLFVFNFHFAAPTRHLCRPEQRDALLEYKNEFEIRKPSFQCYINGSNVSPYPKMESWENNTDCCYWDGIKCDAKSGEVIGLDLRCSCLYGKFHSNTSLLRLQNFHFLTTLDLSFNDLYGQIPSSIGNLSLLTSLDLSRNHFFGQIPSSIENLSHLIFLDLSKNQFSGEIPSSIGNISQLTFLVLSDNQFIGPIPSWIENLSHLDSLDLSDNQFIGPIPFSIGNLSHLTFLDLSDNQFIGPIPSWIGNLSHLEDLILSRNNFTGEIPNSFASLNKLKLLDVGFNKLSRNLPISLLNFYTLEVLNVESNKINDTFPFWLTSLQNLQVLVLRSNAFHGPIHQASLLHLKIIDISHNHFSGILPSDYFVNWSKMSSLGTEEDQPNDRYMRYSHGYYKYSMVLTVEGVEMELVRILEIYTALDFSGNRLEGEIPRSIGLLKELHVLNLSNNAFTGHIPSSMGNLTALESLDVSQNKLSGEIPQEIGNLSYLAYMNFSHNQLVGLVPGGTQFRTQPCSSFEENSGLFSRTLDKDCGDIYHTPSSQQFDTPEPEEEDEEVLSWIAAAIGFVPGIAFGMMIGYILVSYKPRWFTSPFGRNKHRSRSTTEWKICTWYCVWICTWCFCFCVSFSFLLVILIKLMKKSQ